MDTIRQTLTLAIIRLLKPVVRILLRHGISHAEFSELAKLVYVDVSENEFQVDGRKQSVSRICVLTGLHRKDVNSIREKLGRDDLGIEQLGRAARVISGWRNDSTFEAERAGVKILPLEGEVSFTSLVKRYSGDMPVRAILDELIMSGSVRQNEDKEIELLKDTYIPSKSDESILRILGVSVADLLNTIDFNLARTPDQASRLQLVVDYKKIPLSKIDEFKKFSQRQSLDSIKAMDAWLNEHSANQEEQEETRRLGFGMYYFENELEALPYGESHE